MKLQLSLINTLYLHNNVFLISHINTSDAYTGLSPLQLATKYTNLPVVKSLVASGASIEHIDQEGNTVYHFAASTNRDIILVNINIFYSIMYHILIVIMIPLALLR